MGKNFEELILRLARGKNQKLIVGNYVDSTKN